MVHRCPMCNKEVDTITKDGLCIECMATKRRQDILSKASQSNDSSFFKEWTPKDRTTAFFEAFGQYVKNPNKRDFMTIYHIWLWAVHDDKPLVETIHYTLKWANMSIHQEYKKWKQE